MTAKPSSGAALGPAAPGGAPRARLTPQEIRDSKGRFRLVSATAVDMPTALWCAQAGLDIVLVGDSLGMVSFGLPDTTGVTMEMMLNATAAAARGLARGPEGEQLPCLVADLPLVALADPLTAARNLMRAGADAVKVECHAAGAPAMRLLRAADIPVMAHVGLMPQEVHSGEGYKLKGATADSAARIGEAALAAEQAGCFACVLEKMPRDVSARLTASLAIPTIGIGAGPECDGQILVLYDLLGIFDRFRPKFVRRYADIGARSVDALRAFATDVRSGNFPSDTESF